jgi:prepilin-type N-terminal cleavage/methylation domain-containing protein
MRSFSPKQRNISTKRFVPSSKTAGFTLIELLISVAIIGIVTSIVLLKYTAFDSTTLLKGAAYEIALALRETQMKSVSVVQDDDDNFRSPYGVSFTPVQKSYALFRYTDEAEVYPKPIPVYDIMEDSVAADDKRSVNIGTSTLDRSMRIQDVCVIIDDPDNPDCGISRLDISFRRPEFIALFNAPGYAGNMEDITSAQIEIASTNNDTDIFLVDVTRLGQISVQLKP